MHNSSAEPLFTGAQLKKLIVPLVVEQLLAVTVGMADTIMITSRGEAYVSGISLVDSISFLLINLLSALCTGGAVIAAQYLGRRDYKNARASAEQLVFTAAALGLLLALLAVTLTQDSLRLIFGSIEADVMAHAEKYFFITAFSYPGLAVYNACAALFRSMGNSKYSMLCSFVMNLINIGGNAAFIYGLGWGVEGAAVPTLLSRTTAAVIMVLLIRDPHHALYIRNIFAIRPRWEAIRRILRIGLPNGIENSMFQAGKLIVQRVVTSFGTAAIAANAIVGSITSVMMVPGTAIGLALITVVGQCIGAGEYGQMRSYVKKLMLLLYGCVVACSFIVYFGCEPLLPYFNLSDEALAMARQICLSYALAAPFFWPGAFPFVNVLRAAGDVKFTMAVSLSTMVFCRIALSYVFAAMGLGLQGVWLAMYCDWVVRSVIFHLRYRSGAWKKNRVID